MRITEEAMFRWVLIVGVAGLSVGVLAMLTRPLFGALWGLVLVIAGLRHAYLWAARKRREN